MAWARKSSTSLPTPVCSARSATSSRSTTSVPAVLELERMGEKKADNLFAGIEAAKSRGLARVLVGLGIHHIGSTASRILAEHFGSIDALTRCVVRRHRQLYGSWSGFRHRPRDRPLAPHVPAQRGRSARHSRTEGCGRQARRRTIGDNGRRRLRPGRKNSSRHRHTAEVLPRTDRDVDPRTRRPSRIEHFQEHRLSCRGRKGRQQTRKGSEARSESSHRDRI